SSETIIAHFTIISKIFARIMTNNCPDCPK
ncbi:hypothetical protein A5868_001505, partial [Enterococcus sp. 12F9_DIV0723]